MADKPKVEIEGIKVMSEEEFAEFRKENEGNGIFIESEEQLATDDRIPPDVRKKINEFTEMLEVILNFGNGEDEPEDNGTFDAAYEMGEEEFNRRVEEARECAKYMVAEASKNIFDHIMSHPIKSHKIPTIQAHMMGIMEVVPMFVSAMAYQAMRSVVDTISIRDDCEGVDREEAQMKLNKIPFEIHEKLIRASEEALKATLGKDDDQRLN